MKEQILHFCEYKSAMSVMTGPILGVYLNST